MSDFNAPLPTVAVKVGIGVGATENGPYEKPLPHENEKSFLIEKLFSL